MDFKPEDATIMRNVRRLISGRIKQPMNWVLYMEIFACGRTSANEACEYLGLDPDSKETPRNPNNKGG